MLTSPPASSPVSSNEEPKLAPPGAGIPWLPRMIFRHFVLPWKLRQTSWDQCVIRFLKEGERILAMTEGKTSEQLSKRVLVAPMTGLEDSSRYWSAAMTIEHLMIAGQGMTAIALELMRGRSPAIEADTAKVKPPATVDAEMIRVRFRGFLAETAEKVRGAEGDRRALGRHRHPWFGGLTAHEWVFMLAFHQRLHRAQIESILRGA